MITLKETHAAMMNNPAHWRIPLMDFVDDFRQEHNLLALQEPFSPGDPALDALLASTAESLCRELNIPPPTWLESVPASPKAWFVSGFDSLRAIALAESPLDFRVRKIFVLENFLSRA
ncbi:MAG: hypothetical protein IPN19_00815 [Elusimicrobia bacterium]|nr:hypothetical protein [Elusimicrobiota bacterium]